MRFTINTAGGALIQTVNCLTVTATSTTQITFGSCLRANQLGGLASVPTASKIIVNDLNGTNNGAGTGTGFTTVGNVGNTTNNTTTQNYVVTSNPALNALVTNTFWMQSTGAKQDWMVVTCSGITTNTNTANAGPFTVTALSSCSNVPATIAGANVIATAAPAAANVGTIGGYLKIEIQKADFTWKDVTMEVLNWGFGDNNQDGTICGDPTPNAIIRLQRLHDNGATGNLGCTYAGSTNSYDYWPNTIFDTREALFRSVAPATNDAMLGGVMHYVGLDVGNLSKWLNGAAPYGAGSGNQALSVSGYTVYFSDRRNNRSDGTNATCTDPNLPAPCATGEYGFEDVVNSTNAAGTPNAALDAGEDVNGNGLLDTYGQFPNFMGVINALPPGAAAAAAPWNSAATIRPGAAAGRASAMTSRTLLFRRALKLQNAGQGNIVMPGLTVATENPLYIQGDWNWNGSTLTTTHAETSVIADAVTLLSTAWTDANAFKNPYDASQRVRAASGWYRIAIVGGKSMAFTWPTVGGPDSTFGTDGGVHNFLRYLETGAGTVNYVGSTATFYYSRQGVGTYKFNLMGTSVVYSAPTRAYAFDTDFLNPATLPPLTPVFRDVNILGFSQEMRPGK